MGQIKMQSFMPIPQGEFTEESVNRFGVGLFEGKQTVFGLPEDYRKKNILLVGKAGRGKSIIVKKLVEEDIQLGKKVIVIDAMGGLITELMSSEAVTSNKPFVMRSYEEEFAKIFQSDDTIALGEMLRREQVILCDMSRGIKILESQSMQNFEKLMQEIYELGKQQYNIQFEDRKPIYLYLDDINYHSDTLPAIISESRPMQCSITMTCQYLDSVSSELQHVILGNTANYILFAMAMKDCEFFSKHLSLPFPAEHLHSLPQGQFIVSSFDLNNNASYIWSGTTIL